MKIVESINYEKVVPNNESLQRLSFASHKLNIILVLLVLRIVRYSSVATLELLMLVTIIAIV